MSDSSASNTNTPVSELVRAAPPEWLRLVVIAGIAILGAFLFAATRPLTWGSSGGIDWLATKRQPVATLSMELSNHSIFPVEVTGVQKPAGVGAAQLKSGPVRIPPLTSRTVNVTVEITSCAHIDPYEKAITLTARTVPFGWTHEEKVTVPLTGPPEGLESTLTSTPETPISTAETQRTDPQRSSPAFGGGPETGWLTAAANGACTR
jgi:hypothetical protein